MLKRKQNKSESTQTPVYIWTKHLAIRPELINCLEENIGRTYHDIGCESIFSNLRSLSKHTENKPTGIHQIKKLFHSKKNVSITCIEVGSNSYAFAETLVSQK